MKSCDNNERPNNNSPIYVLFYFLRKHTNTTLIKRMCANRSIPEPKTGQGVGWYSPFRTCLLETKKIDLFCKYKYISE